MIVASAYPEQSSIRHATSETRTYQKHAKSNATPVGAIDYIEIFQRMDKTIGAV